MNLLMDALKKAEERRASFDSSPGDEPPGSAELRERPFGPIRATRDEAGSVVIESDPDFLAGPRPGEPALSGAGRGGTVAPADRLEDALGGLGSGATAAPSGGTALSSPSPFLGGEDATHDEPPPFSSLDGAGAPLESRLGVLPRVSEPPEPARVTENGEDAAGSEDGRPPGSRLGDATHDEPPPFSSLDGAGTPLGSRLGVLPRVSEPPEPARVTENDEDAAGGEDGRPSPAQSDDRSTTTAVRTASVGTAPRSFEARVAPPGRRTGRTIGVALLLLAVTAGGAAGGRHVWKTEFARPALLRPPLPASAAEAAPVWTADATAGTSGDSGDPEARAPHPQRTQGPRRNQGERRAGTALRPPLDAGAPTRPATGMDATPRPDTGAVIRITKRRRSDRVGASLERAYDAFQAGDAESAADAYRAVLGHEPRNRDAFLGLAAVAAREGRWNEAAAHYARVLAIDPADAVAQAALIAIGEQDPALGKRLLKEMRPLKEEGLLKEEGPLVAEGFLTEEGLPTAESRLKALLSGEPRAAYLHFGLGNVYAAQSRWPEARRSYFNAYRLDRGNTDYAYNLAVSLDHLSQPESAIRFYREALALAEKRSPNFETDAVLARIRDLATP